MEGDEEMTEKEPEDIFFDFLMALHGMKKVGAVIQTFYGVPAENNTYELRLVLKKK